MNDKKDSSHIAEIAEERICEDRKKLEELQEKLLELAKSSDNDLIACAAISEHITRIADSLTKQTAQLIELAKIKQKNELIVKRKDSLSESDVEDLYDNFDERETIN